MLTIAAVDLPPERQSRGQCVLEHPTRRLETRPEPQLRHGWTTVPIPRAQCRRPAKQGYVYTLFLSQTMLLKGAPIRGCRGTQAQSGAIPVQREDHDAWGSAKGHTVRQGHCLVFPSISGPHTLAHHHLGVHSCRTSAACVIREGIGVD